MKRSLSAKQTCRDNLQNRLRIGMRGIAALTVMLVLPCCNANKVYYPYKSVPQKFPNGTRILIEPTATTGKFPTSYETGMLALRELVRNKLTQAGYYVLSEEESSAALTDNSPFATNIFSPATGKIDHAKVRLHRLAYLRELAARGVCDLVLSPSVAVHRAEYMGMTARWDGVMRSIYFDYTNLGARSPRGHGFGIGLSLGVLISDLTGRTLHESWGGIDLPHRIKFNPRPENTWEHIMREKALADPRMRNEAVSLALHPFVVYDGYPKEPDFSSN